MKKKSAKAPESYLNERRPSYAEAIKAEGEIPISEAIASLKRKGYFTARPRPWKLGVRDRGHGHEDFAVLDRFGDLVAEVTSKEDAELIVAAVNACKA